MSSLQREIVIGQIAAAVGLPPFYEVQDPEAVHRLLDYLMDQERPLPAEEPAVVAASAPSRPALPAGRQEEKA